VFRLVLHAVALASMITVSAWCKSRSSTALVSRAVVLGRFWASVYRAGWWSAGWSLALTLADDLEEQVRARFVDGQIAQFVHREDSGFEVTLEFAFEPANGLVPL